MKNLIVKFVFIQLIFLIGGSATATAANLQLVDLHPVSHQATFDSHDVVAQEHPLHISGQQKHPSEAIEFGFEEEDDDREFGIKHLPSQGNCCVSLLFKAQASAAKPASFVYAITFDQSYVHSLCEHRFLLISVFRI